ncbi:MAG TPA: hypothetical protein ENI80_01650 [Acidiferrobacteraceae bacterium]|nr:hypothetical protein [Acidiferrobacteraceae bacterium]
MGSYLGYRCSACGYEEAQMGIGSGRQAGHALVLYHCYLCKSVGSAWKVEGQEPRCSYCYHPDIHILDIETRNIECPKCGEPAKFFPKEGEWE